MKIAYSNLACPEWSIEDVFQNARRFGYDGVELRLLDGNVIRPDLDTKRQLHILEAARQNAIEIVGIGASTQFASADSAERERNVQELLKYVELASCMEVPFVRTFGGEDRGAEGSHGPSRIVERVSESLNTVAERAKELGVQVLLETHDGFSSSYRVREVLNSVLNPAIGALWDTHHPVRMGESASETFENLRTRLCHVHLKDAQKNGDGWDLVVFGEGDVPVSDIVSTLVQSGYDQYLCVEWERKWHPEIESADLALPKHIEILRQYLANARAHVSPSQSG